MMRFYNPQHPFYCGVDLHAESLHLCVLDQAGEILRHRGIRARPQDFLQTIEPYRKPRGVGAPCMFAWYWLSDLCIEEVIPFMLGHARYMPAIHGGKTKKHNKPKAMSVLAAKRGRAVYWMLRRKTVFDVNKLFAC